MGGGMQFELSRIKFSKLSEKEKELILGRNALRLLGYEVHS
jgi:predicted TIM-barrel fold metal-dependent hydrolase